MSRKGRIRFYLALCVIALGCLAAQQVDFRPVVKLTRDIVILNDGVEEQMLAMLKEFLQRRLGLSVRIEANVASLSLASRPQRHQWKLEALLDAVHQRVRGEGRRVLLTSKDTFAGDANWNTGVAFCDSTTAVVSVCRLNPAFWGDAYDRALHYKRVRKIMLHELGHTFGVRGHCEDWHCAVHGSGSIGEIDRTGEDYCQRCDKLSMAAVEKIRGRP